MTRNMKNAKQAMEQMFLERGQLGDITFVVESQRIRAHRIVLATQSPKYKAQFYGMHPDEDEIHVPYISAAAFNVFLQFFYKETVDLTMENIEMVVDLAKQSLVDEFIESCFNFLKNAIEANNNLCDAYRLAHLYDIESLRLYCEQRISINTFAFFASDDFLQCDHDALVLILKMDTFNCTEIDVFYACIAWARAYCRESGLDDEVPGNLRAVLDDAIYQIRYSSFNSEKFAELHKSLEGFFTAEESIELFYITSKLKNLTSQKFNLNLRTSGNEAKPSPSVPMAWTLELSRFARMKRVAGEIVVARRSNFSFTCNNPIRLHGIALGIHFGKDVLDSFPKFLTVTKDASKNALKCKVYQSPVRHNEIMILLEKPMERVTNFSCDIQLPFRRLNYQFDLRSSAQTNSTAFSFGDGEWVTRVFFDKYVTTEFDWDW